MKRGWFKGERVDVVVVCGTLCFCHLQPGWRRTPTAVPKAGIQHGLLQRGQKPTFNDTVMVDPSNLILRHIFILQNVVRNLHSMTQSWFIHQT